MIEKIGQWISDSLTWAGNAFVKYIFEPIANKLIDLLQN